MLFFHATTKVFTNGERFTAPPVAEIGPNALAALEATRPLGAPSREKCFFACDDPANAMQLVTAERRYRRAASNIPVYLYRVGFPAGHWSGPMALIGAIEKKLRNGQPAERAISEYWSPALPWQFLEVFGPELRIVALEPIPSFMDLAAAALRYSSDHAQAASL